MIIIIIIILEDNFLITKLLSLVKFRKTVKLKRS